MKSIFRKNILFACIISFIVSLISLYYFKEIKNNYIPHTNMEIKKLDEKLKNFILEEQNKNNYPDYYFKDEKWRDEFFKKLIENNYDEIVIIDTNRKELLHKKLTLNSYKSLSIYILIISLLIFISIIFYFSYYLAKYFIYSLDTTILQRLGFIILIISIIIFIISLFMWGGKGIIYKNYKSKIYFYLSIILFIISLISVTGLLDKTYRWIKDGKK